MICKNLFYDLTMGNFFVYRKSYIYYLYYFNPYNINEQNVSSGMFEENFKKEIIQMNKILYK